MTNLTIQTDTAKMIIKATVTEKKTIDKEITLPYYCKKSTTFFCIKSEKDAFKVDTSTTYSSITKSETWIWADDISNCEECTKQDFTDALDTLLLKFESIEAA